MASPELIGRDVELARLRDAWGRATDGRPTSVLVSGEAGIGKTRLVQDFARRVRTDGARLWTGRCLPLTEALMPYAPIAEILSAVVADIGTARMRELTGPVVNQLALLVPDLDTAGTIQRVVTDPQGLHSAVLRLVKQLAREGAILVIEDLHWADASTRDLLVVIMRGLTQGRLLLICTWRDDELAKDDPLWSFLVEARRSGVDDIALGRLDPAGTAAQIAGILRAEPDPVLAERIHRRSGGNPFLVEELVAAGSLDGEALPQQLLDVLLPRVRRLPPAAKQVLQAVAFAGGTIGHSTLGDVVPLSADDVIDGARTAVDAHLLVADGDRYAYRHALIAEAVVAEALPGERVQLHRALAEAFEARLPGPSTDPGRTAGNSLVPASALAAGQAEVAYHWLGAGDLDRALIATVAAGLASELASALPEARQHFTRALGLWWQVRPDARDRAALDLVGLFEHAAESAYLVGAVDEALALLRRGIETAEAQEDLVRNGLLHVTLGRYLSTSASTEPAVIAAYEAAVRLVPPAPCAERARVLAGLARILMMSNRYRESLTWAEQALDVARQSGARHEESHALATLGVDLTRIGESAAGLDRLRQGLAIAEELDTAYHLAGAYAALSDGLLGTGEFVEAASVALRGVQSAERHGTERIFGAVLLGNAMEAWFWLGRWDDMATRLPQPGGGDGHPVPATLLWLPAASLYTAQGRFEEAERILEECRQVLAAGGTSEIRDALHVALAELSVWCGKPATAQQWAERGLELAGASEPGAPFARLLAVGARAVADQAGPDGTDMTRAVSDFSDLLARRRDQVILSRSGAAHFAVAEAELARTGVTDAASAWARSATAWTRLDAPYPLAYARWRQAEALLAGRGNRRPAARALHEAQDIARRLRAQPLEREVSRLARRARLDLSSNRPNGAAPPEDHAAYRLTRREEQVLGLMCEGRTDREIANHLFISPKTVGVHVSHVLAKLGVPNRAAATAAAHRLGLIR